MGSLNIIWNNSARFVNRQVSVSRIPDASFLQDNLPVYSENALCVRNQSDKDERIK